MHTVERCRSASRTRGGTISRYAMMMGLFAVALCPDAFAQQLKGTYTVGTGKTYPTIEAAIAAVTANGVSGPVVFEIAGGSYTMPAAGYTLSQVASMSAANTVTFRPASGATVTIDATHATAVFDINGGDYYRLDGSEAEGGTGRNWKIINRSTSGRAIRFINGATNNVVRNMTLIGNAPSNTAGVVAFTTSSTGGNNNNIVAANTIGDATAALRSGAAVYASGSSTASDINTGNAVEGNDIVNFGSGANDAHGISILAGNRQMRIAGNQIHIDNNADMTANVEGIRYNNTTDNQNDTIAGNRIWNLAVPNRFATIRGIYLRASASSPVTVHGNMISVVADEGTISGLYIDPSSTSAITNVYYNSIYVGGASAIAPTTSHGIYIASAAVLRNNVVVNNRLSSGAGTNRLLHRETTSGTLTSNTNLLYASAPGTAVGFTGSVRATLADWRSGSGQDAGSITGAPGFINPAAGDLHIQNSTATPVEGRGSAIAGFTSDFDLQTRNATTPDLGADEGNFQAAVAGDMAASHVVSPAGGTVIAAGALFTPSGVFTNNGTTDLANVPVRLRIRDAVSNTIQYDNTQTIASIAAGDMTAVTFAPLGASLPAGTYTVELISELPSDPQNGNDMAASTIIVRGPMSGSYTINPAGSGTRNFTSIPAALFELKLLGVGGPVTFELAGGSHTSLNVTFPLVFTQVAGMSAANTVTFRPATGATVTMDANNSTAIIDIDGGDYYIFNGSNAPNGTGRNWQVINRSGRAIRFINGATNNVVRNMYLLSENSSTATGIVAFTTAASAGNSDNLLAANTIGDSTGTVRSAVGVYASGTATAKNTGNRIEGNDIINFGNGGTDATGVQILSGNQMTRITGNRINIAAKGTFSGNADGIRFSNSADNLLDTIAFNIIRDLSSTSTSTAREYNGVNVAALGTVSALAIHNNMIALSAGTGTVNGIKLNASSPALTGVVHNSISISGTTTAASSSAAVFKSSDAAAVMRNNILSNTRTSTGTSYNTLVRTLGTNGPLTADNNLFYNSGATTSIGASGSSTITEQKTMADWRTASGQDGASLLSPGAVPFTDESTGNLRIDPKRIFSGESLGAPTDITVDFDLANRSATAPDAGADEGDFNGGGIQVLAPNGGENIPVNYTMNVNFTSGRPLAARVQISVDGGTTWSDASSLTTVQGANSVTVSTPGTTTAQALVRVISTLNAFEADTSNAVFSLVNPVVTLLAPNGGESFVPTDTAKLRWSSQFVDPGMRLTLEFSSNGGASWASIADDVTTTNIPGNNGIDWIIPDAPTADGLVRVRVKGRTDADTSNATFRIVPKPAVTLLSPNGGETIAAGETSTVRWNAVTTDYVRLEYSTDSGATWATIVPGSADVPAYMGSYPWNVPGVSSTRALVRVVNAERPRFSDASDAVFTILNPAVEVISPNGGEKYELNDPVTVTWNAQGTGKLRLDYSTDNGRTWMPALSDIDAGSGSVQFTPAAVPTPRALVRLVDVNRNAVQDQSDAAFEIMPARAITVYAPMSGDRFIRNSTTVINWNAPRVADVRIEYSANNGGTWATIVTSVAASQGSSVWTVPNQLTNDAKIRIVEINGTIVAESGVFAVVDQAPPTLRVVRPNGGENYTAGDVAEVFWTASSLSNVSVSYSSDGGTTWSTIVANVPATSGRVNWTITSQPGSNYRIKVEGNGGVADISDASFTVSPKVVPALTVLYPNGGENFMADSAVEVRWDAENISGDVKIEYSIDGGSAWKHLATVPALNERFAWVIPNDTTRQALLRISSAGGTASDVSDARWRISARPSEPVLPVRVLAPNGGQILKFGQQYTITWDAPDAVAAVNLYYSADSGTSWNLIQANVASVAGNRQYVWTVPTLGTRTGKALVRVWNVADTSNRDLSDAPFAIEPVQTTGVDEAATGAAGLRLAGNYPNPFVGATEIRWEQARAGAVELALYGADGRIVHRRMLGDYAGGEQRHLFSGGDLASGMYVYELRIGTEAVRGTMMVIR